MLLGNVVPLWETMLAAMKLGVIVIPATTLLTADELRDRLDRGQAKAVVATQDQVAKFEGLGEGLHQDRGCIYVRERGLAQVRGCRQLPGRVHAGWYDECRRSNAALFHVGHHGQAEARAAQPSQLSGRFAVDHVLARLAAGDVHLNISSPGWAKHAWSCFFSPWNAGATIFIVNQPRFDAKNLLATVARCGVTTLCAPPTVWRLFIQEQLADYKVSVREVCGAGEPLNPEVIDQVKAAWGLTIRDGYGQTETTALAGNSPGQVVKVGSMGRPMPGYTVRVADADGNPAKEGEVRLVLGADRPAGLMLGYQGEDGKPKGADGDVYQTGDVVFLDDDGYLTFVGRSDDVFKSSDYRISPFELESVLLEHEMVAEAAVVPTPDPIRLALPKAYVSLVPGTALTRDTALSIFKYVHSRLAPFKRIRRIELVTELPKTISGKIRRVQLRRLEHDNDRKDALRGQEFREEIFRSFRRPALAAFPFFGRFVFSNRLKPASAGGQYLHNGSARPDFAWPGR
jgi:acetyl-CoA synthetase